jgi:hypothetical protein
MLNVAIRTERGKTRVVDSRDRGPAITVSTPQTAGSRGFELAHNDLESPYIIHGAGRNTNGSEASPEEVTYPVINWDLLPGRLHKFNNAILNVIGGVVPERYKNEYDERRTLNWDHVYPVMAGYYGPRGADIM